MSTRRRARATTRGKSVGSSEGMASRKRLDPTFTVLAIRYALSELGIHATLRDIVARAQSIEKETIRSGRKPEQMC